MTKSATGPSRKVSAKNASVSIESLTLSVARDAKQAELWSKSPYDAFVTPENRAEFITTCSLKLLDDCFRWAAYAILIDWPGKPGKDATKGLWRMLATIEHGAECFDRHASAIAQADEPIIHGKFVANSWTEIPRAIAQEIIDPMRLWAELKMAPIRAIHELADSIVNVNYKLCRNWIEREERLQNKRVKPLATRTKCEEQKKYDLQKDLSIVDSWERAKNAKISKKEFAQGITAEQTSDGKQRWTVRDVDGCLNREYARRKREMDADFGD